MTPKEKAKDLLCNFYAIQSDEYNYGINWKMAKQCALIAVDEMIYETQFEVPNIRQRYWMDVKTEIENL
jgi:hypothetical protein